MARQHKNYKRIAELEWMLHKIKGREDKDQERKVIFAELNQLDEEMKETQRVKNRLRKQNKDA